MERTSKKMDYELFLSQSGISDKLIREQSEEDSDLDETELKGVRVYNSLTSGSGLFAEKPFKPGDFICLARVDGKRTLAGRYTNHSPISNSSMVVNGDLVDLIASRDIHAGDEITVNYREVMQERLIKGDLCQE